MYFTAKTMFRSRLKYVAFTLLGVGMSAPVWAQETENAPIGRESLLGIIILLSILVLALLGVINRLANGKLQSDIAAGKVEGDQLKDVNLFKRIHPGLYVVFGLVGFFILMTAGAVDLASKVGMQQGYGPKQPIAYSHKLHAGEYKIQCSYCHTGVERGKSATIPSANVCMNCHNTIKPESEQIQKIYDAVGWDPATQAYIPGYKQKPIQWVRIHNLQDFAYFNHSQHYKVGGIACQTCHGPIETMEVVKQQSPLTMGWCIDCHTKTKVNMDNGYYKSVHGKSEKFKQAVASGEGMTISQLGGMECSKCHY